VSDRPVLSILVCSTDTRCFSFAPRVLGQIFSQRNELPDPSRVEVIVVTDTKGMTIGAKRNWLVRMASGVYVQFIDDDDTIADDMLAQVLSVTETDCDVIAFPAMVRVNGGPWRKCYYSVDFTHDHSTATEYRRLPNHICAVKRVLALDTPFADICMGEDADYARRLFPKINSEAKIEKPLYFYDYDRRTSESRR
jgi:glycosyltransferase involved in cell wall biosynthesis